MKGKIKVVKKDEARLLKKNERRRKVKKAPRHDMVTTVTGWVTDLKQRKNEDAVVAFDMLFPSKPRASES
jgi:hypothetical protein